MKNYRTILHCLTLALCIALHLGAQDAMPSPTPSPAEPAETSEKPAPSPAPDPGGIEATAAPEESPSPLPEPDDVEAPAVTSDVPPPPATPQPAATPLPVPEGSSSFPGFNIYLPEGQFDIRVRRLIKNVLFEGQVSYNFVDGDVSTFLRYKYYARSLTYKIGVFDSIEFESIDDPSGDFDRVRGGLLQFEYPSNYDSRYFLLLQDDRLLFGDVDNPDNTKNNVFLKLGYQYGTPFDERLNSIVGESRGRTTPVLTTYRDLGRQRLGLAVAATQAIDAAGDYSYTKFETELIKRFDLGSTTFLVSRLHAGTFFDKNPGETPPDLDDEDLLEQPTYLFSIPRYDYFRLGDRDAMKSLDSDSRGTDEAHLSNELFAPIFRNRNYRTKWITWTNLYGIVYSGIGTVGFDSDEATALAGYEFGDLVVDGGLGFEASAMFRETEIFLSAIYARTLKSPDALDSNEFRVSLRTRR